MIYTAKSGEFYLGKQVDIRTKKTVDRPFFYDSKDLTTHAVTVGMTGSGKTGLAIALIEEAGLNKIPVLMIDPKGDLGDLLLTFPHLSPEEFLPWIDRGEAEREGLNPKDFSKKISDKWKTGLEEWGESIETIQALKKDVEMTIYTPASRAGVPLSILSSFAAPPKELILDPEAFRERIMSTVSSLLGLIGIHADPIKSREHILLSTLLDHAWSQGKNLDIPTIIQQIQKPPFNKVGILDLETFFPIKERTAFSISLNNLLASPGFQAWMEGEPLNISNLLYTEEGKPKLSIISIAHLSDDERMFFVTLLLNEYLSWMRRQTGSSSLKTILYMDEIFGYFPPTATPPSKKPMITLLKQARAYGVGVMLATQNPVDLDYKGLSNCGTWFIGKLQTERDKARVLEGLKLASNGEIDTNTLDKMVALTGNRTFIMRSVHQKDPVLFQTRWTLSYLKGPLTLVEIASLTKKDELSEKIEAPVSSASSTKPMIPAELSEYFLPYSQKGTAHYVPYLLGRAKLHFVDAKNKIDSWKEVTLLFPASEEKIDWEHGMEINKKALEKNGAPNSSFESLPSPLSQGKNSGALDKAFAAALYQNQTLTLYKFGNITSQDEESLDAFKVRIAEAARKDIAADYDKKIEAVRAKMAKAEEKASTLEQKATQEKTSTWISFGTTVLGAFLGKGLTKGTISQAGTAFKKIGKMSKGSEDASKATENYKNYQQELDDLEEQKAHDMKWVKGADIEKIEVRPRKSDISVEEIALVWKP